MRRAFLLALGAALAFALPAQAADAWPVKPVRIVIAAPPGGVADVLARMAAEGMARDLGQPVLVEYKPGASGTIAVQELVAAPADGHTFLLIQRGIASELPLAMKIRYDPYADLQPVAQLARLGLLLVGGPQLEATDLPGLVTQARARPGDLPFAAVGAGLLSHTTGLQFGRATGLPVTFVNYQGAAPAVQALLGGHVPLMVEGPPAVVALVRSGKVRAYATTAPSRTAALPDVPTFAELGYPQLTETSWLALWSRPQVPPEIGERVRAALQKWLALPATQARLADLGMDPGLPLSAAELARDVREASARQAQVLRAIGFRSE